MKAFRYMLVMITLIIPLFAQATEDQNTQNPLVEEMRILDNTFKEVVSAVAVGNGSKVNESLESLHGLREKTHKAIKSGIIRLPKNHHRVREFLKLDIRFHTELELLSKAAHKNNQRKMLILTKKLLDGCVNCHRVFKR